MRSSKGEKSAVEEKNGVQTACENGNARPLAGVPSPGEVDSDTSSACPQVIGLTGGIGTGKSTASSYLVAQGLVLVDADAISRQITEKKPGVDNPVLQEIDRAFAEADVLRHDGSLDRQKMAGLVFHDSEKKKLLEGILFRHIEAEIRRQIAEAGQGTIAGAQDMHAEETDAVEAAPSQSRLPIVLLDVPLLFESGLDSLCEKVIVLTADVATRIRRVTARDGCSPEDVQARIANQMPDAEKCARADFVVDNSGSLEELQEKLDRVMKVIQ